MGRQADTDEAQVRRPIDGNSFGRQRRAVPTMTTHIPARACALFISFLFLGLPCLRAESMQGTVTDPTGAPIAGARVAATNRVGVIGETVTNAAGRFEIN